MAVYPLVSTVGHRRYENVLRPLYSQGMEEAIWSLTDNVAMRDEKIYGELG